MTAHTVQDVTETPVNGTICLICAKPVKKSGAKWVHIRNPK